MSSPRYDWIVARNSSALARSVAQHGHLVRQGAHAFCTFSNTSATRPPLLLQGFARFSASWLLTLTLPLYSLALRAPEKREMAGARCIVSIQMPKAMPLMASPSGSRHIENVFARQTAAETIRDGEEATLVFLPLCTENVQTLTKKSRVLVTVPTESKRCTNRNRC